MMRSRFDQREHRWMNGFVNWGATQEERRAALPGDELVRIPVVRSTMAVSIDAPPSVVWPWLAQMGQDRGGMYSYQALENVLGLKIHNADRIHPEWQEVAVGDVVRLVPKGWFGLRDGLALPVAAMVPGCSIVLRTDPASTPWNSVWSFHLDAEGRGARLLSRTVTARQSGWAAATGALMDPITAAMTRKMLLGIKSRAERPEGVAHPGQSVRNATRAGR